MFVFNSFAKRFFFTVLHPHQEKFWRGVKPKKKSQGQTPRNNGLNSRQRVVAAAPRANVEVLFTHTPTFQRRKRDQMPERYLAYYRVSTVRQGRSGLGLEAQKAEVNRMVNEEGADLVGEVTEVESGKDERNRPLLLEALARCRKDGSTLLVAKLCRLSRDAAFVLTLMKDSKVRFKVAAMPQADNFQLGIWALLNQQEREQISRRTKEALAAAKARGVRLGGTGGAHASLEGMNRARQQRAAEYRAKVAPLVVHLREQGMTLQKIADALNASGSSTSGGCAWRATQVLRVLQQTSQSVNAWKHWESR